VTVGETTEYRMDIWDTAYTLAPGHRLRLWLGSSDTPTHEPLPEAGRNLILHDADHPSQLLLGRAGEQAPAPTARAAAGSCRAVSVRVPRGLRRARVTAGGKRVKVRHRRATVRPRAGTRRITFRIRGIDSRGRRLTLTRRVAACR
jgi:hypothetical protein